jgi:hypothetical protein
MNRPQKKGKIHENTRRSVSGPGIRGAVLSGRRNQLLRRRTIREISTGKRPRSLLLPGFRFGLRQPEWGICLEARNRLRKNERRLLPVLQRLPVGPLARIVPATETQILEREANR